eukprot:scpid44633/ scgid16265/ 
MATTQSLAGGELPAHDDGEVAMAADADHHHQQHHQHHIEGNAASCPTPVPDLGGCHDNRRGGVVGGGNSASHHPAAIAAAGVSVTPEESQAAETLTQLTWQQPVLRSVSPASTTSDVDVVGTQRHRQQEAANAADDPGYVAPASASHRIHDNKSRQAQQAPQHSHGQDSADFEQRQPEQEKEDIGAPPPALMRVQAPVTTPVATDNWASRQAESSDSAIGNQPIIPASGQNQDGQRVQLWQFLVELLQDEKHRSIICWTEHRGELNSWIRTRCHTSGVFARTGPAWTTTRCPGQCATTMARAYYTRCKASDSVTASTRRFSARCRVDSTLTSPHRNSVSWQPRAVQSWSCPRWPICLQDIEEFIKSVNTTTSMDNYHHITLTYLPRIINTHNTSNNTSNNNSSSRWKLS